MTTAALDREQKNVVFAVTVGNILEWFEIYSYLYLVPILSRTFFGFHSEYSNLVSALAVFGLGSIGKLFGAYIFGHIGDAIGRKKTFILSIIIITIPTFVIGFLPGYFLWGSFAPFMLMFFRLMQSIPAAGEAAGAFCLLYENTRPRNKFFLTSFAAFGNQIGAILGVLENYFMDSPATEEFLLAWGWRISFWIGGLIGLFGIYLRAKLHETKSFSSLEKHHHLNKHAFRTVCGNFKGRVLKGVAFGAINASTFYLIAAYMPTFLEKTLSLPLGEVTALMLGILVLATALLPVFGRLGDRFNFKKLLVGSSILIIILFLYIWYCFVQGNMVMLLTSTIVSIFPISCITALVVYPITDLFPAAIRFTGVALAFNLADGILGGFTPVVALVLPKIFYSEFSFLIYIILTAIVSIWAFSRIKRVS